MLTGSLFKYGNKRIQIFRVDSNGYPMGTLLTPDAPTLPTTTHALVLQGYVSATPSVREVDTATDQADGTNYGDIEMGISSFGAVEITLSMRSETAFNLIRGVVPNNTISSAMYITTANNTSIAPRLFGMIITDRVRDEITNVPQYEHTVYNRGTIMITQEAEGNQGGGVNPSPLTISFKPQPSTRLVSIGMLYSATNLAPDENTDTHTIFRSTYQLSATTFVKDGVATTFNTFYKPSVAAATVGGVNVYTTNGVQAALTSLATTTGLATMTAAGTSGHIAVVLYATNFVLV